MGNLQKACWAGQKWTEVKLGCSRQRGQDGQRPREGRPRRHSGRRGPFRLPGADSGHMGTRTGRPCLESPDGTSFDVIGRCFPFKL